MTVQYNNNNLLKGLRDIITMAYRPGGGIMGHSTVPAWSWEEAKLSFNIRLLLIKDACFISITSTTQQFYSWKYTEEKCVNLYIKNVAQESSQRFLIIPYIGI